MRQRIGSRYFVTERGQDPGKGFLTGTEAAGIAVGKTDRSDRSMIEGDALAPRALLGNKGCNGGDASTQIVEQHGIDRGREQGMGKKPARSPRRKEDGRGKGERTR